MNLKAVIFDLDGTLIDSMGIWHKVDKEFLLKRNVAVPDNIFADIEEGNSFHEVAKFFKHKFSLTETIDQIMNEWTDMVKEKYQKEITTKPGVKEILPYLKKNNIKIAVGTSNTHFLTKTVLDSNKIKKYFEIIVDGKNNEIRGKPFPDIYLKVAEKLDIKPEECVVIEDVYVGVLAGKKAGMKVIAIADEYSHHEVIQIKEKADYFVKDFFEVKAIVKQFIERK